MTDNLRIGADAQINNALSVLRDGTCMGDLADHVQLLPGVFLAADPALQISGQYRSPEGRMLEIEATMRGEGHWMALHMALPARDLSLYGCVGFAARIEAPEAQVVQPCLRSGVEGGFVDCFFDKHILALPQPRSHLDALSVHYRDNLPLLAPWRELILFLPARSYRLSFLDLRVFVV